MKTPIIFVLFALLLSAFPTTASAASRQDNIIVLDATGVENLRIQTAVAEPGDFEETIFALGRIEVYPGHRAVISSRIAGRALDVRVKHDHAIKQGDVAVVVESRQVGNPPPSISLTAPISGVVSVVSVVPGEPVNPDKVLAEIIDLTEVYALARVPEHLAGKLRRGLAARITVAAASGDVFDATLEHLGVFADTASGTLEAAFHVANPDLKLRPGMRAEFAIVLSRRTDVVSVPRSAVQGDVANRFVYVKDFDLPHAFVKAPVVVGQTNDRFVEIISGLFPADEVVTQGAYSLGFVGGGSVSLKEALDAAHGHEHNEDGSEITPDQKKPVVSADGDKNEHEHGHADEGESPFWMVVSGVLFVALLGVLFWRNPGARKS